MSDINQQTTVDLQVNGQQAQQTLNQLKTNAQNLETALAKAAAAGNKVELKKLRKELGDTRKQIKQMESSTQSVERVLRNLNKATPKELKQTLSVLQKQLNGMERGSAAWDAHVRKIKAVKGEIASMNAQLNAQQGMFGKLNNVINNWSGAIMGAVGGFMAIKMAFDSMSRTVDAFAEREEQLINVTNTTALLGEDLQFVNDELAKIQTKTSQGDLLKLAEEAGEMGYRTKEEVIAYAKAADQIKVAMSDLGDESVKTFARIANVFDLKAEMGTEQSLLAIASTIDVLGQNCEASKSDIAAFVQGMSGIASVSNMTVPEVAAFSAVLQSNGQAAKQSSAALTKLINDISKDPGKFAKALGVSMDELNKKFENTTEGLVWFFDELNKRGSIAEIAPLLDEMGEGGAKAAGIFNTLAANVDTLRQQLQNANVAFTEANNVTNEYNNINSSLAAQQEMQKKRTHELVVELGEKLAPVVMGLRTGFNALVQVIISLVNFFMKYKGVIITVTASVVAYTVASKAAAAAQAIWNGIMVAGRAAVALFSAAIHLMTGNIVAAQASWTAFSTTLKANPIGLAVAAVTALAVGIYAIATSGEKANQVQREMNKLHEDAASKVMDEKTKIDLLVQAAEDERLSLEDRRIAITKLNQIIPNYNAQLDATTGKYRANKQALDDYISSLVRMYEVQGAKDKLVEIGKKRANIKLKIDDYESKIAEENQRRSSTQSGYVPGFTGFFDSGMSEINYFHGEIANLKNELKGLDDLEKSISKAYGKDIQQSVLREPTQPTITNPVAPTMPSGGRVSGGSVTPRSTTTQGARSIAAGRSAAHATTGAKPEESYLQKATREHERNVMQLQIAYMQGLKNYDEYISAMNDEDKRYYEDVTTNTKVGEQDRLKLQKEYLDKQQKAENTSRARTLDGLEDEYKMQQIMARQHYVDGELTNEQYQETLSRAELEYLANRRDLLQQQMNEEKEGSEQREELARKYVEANREYLDKVIADQEAKKQKAVDLANAEEEEKQRILMEHASNLQSMRDEYFGLNAYRAKKEYDAAIALLDEQKAIELAEVANLENADAEKLRIEEAYQKARLALAKKYNQDQTEENENFLQKWVADSQKWLESEMGQAVTKSLDVISNGMKSIFSQMSTIITAEAEIESNKIEQLYDKQISMAEGNKYKEVQLEKEKKEQLAKIKTDAEKKKYKMEVISAIAQTAISAINAYSSAAAVPLVGYILAPIAASAAIAAGMLQVAALKKQQQASESQGYMEGGFTPEGLPDTPAGIVHAGEWVASQRLTKNKRIRPILEALDNAQRTNSVGRLSDDYVTRAINAPSVLADSFQRAQQGSRRVYVENSEATTAAMADYSDTMRQLAERLNEPFVTVNTVTGDTGIKQAQDEYNKLMRNKTPKSRR